MPLIDPVTMSSSLAKGSSRPSTPTGSAPTKGPEAAPPLQPVHTNPGSAAQAARHALAAAILAVLAAAFGRLVADPVPAMATLLPVSAALQLLYAFVCLPAAGSSRARKHRPGEKKKAGEGPGPNVLVTALLSLLLAALAVPFLHVAMVLFGAPFLTHAAHTLLCAAHLAVLALFPLVYAHGVDGAAWAAVASLRAPLDEASGGLAGALAGGWLGAVPIPLDWDRAWQRWPVTVLVGIYAGYVLGRVVGGTVAFGKRF